MRRGRFLSEIKSRERSFKDKSIFTGKIWYRACGKPYWRTSFSNRKSKGQSVYQWICSEKKRFGAKSCSSIAIMEDELYLMLGEYFQDIAENVEEYVNDFIAIYKESDKDESNLKKINSIKKQQWKFKRTNRNKTGHKQNITFSMQAGI